MSVFKNKVGRPSNETLRKRRIIYLLIFLLVIGFVGILIVVLNERKIKELKGSVFSSLNVISVSKPQNQSFSSYGNKEAKYTIKNNTKADIYINWFTYLNKNYSSSKNINYVGKCSCVKSKTSKTIIPTLNVSENHPIRSGKVKIYKTKKACLNDTNGSKSLSLYGTYPVIYKYAVSTTKDVKSTVKTANSKTTKIASTTGTSFRRVIYVGDSRTVGMCAAVGSRKGESCSTNGKLGCDFSGLHSVKYFPEGTYISKSCAANDWFTKTGLPLLKNELNKNSYAVVVINLGTNDLGNINSSSKKYLKQYKDLKKKYPKMELVIVSVTEIDDQKALANGSKAKNSDVISFNKKIKNNLSSNIKYCDVYSEIQNQFVTVDGIHYDNSTYKSIFSGIHKCIDNLK